MSLLFMKPLTEIGKCMTHVSGVQAQGRDKYSQNVKLYMY